MSLSKVCLLLGVIVAPLALGNPLRCPNAAFPAEKCEAIRQQALDVGCINNGTYNRLKGESRFPACVGATMVGDCPCGCFAPEALIDVWAQGGDFVQQVTAAHLFAHSEEYALSVLEDDARLSTPTFRSDSVAQKTIGTENIPLVRIETADGKVLRLTEKHAVLTAEGRMITARELTQGHRLIGRDGSQVGIAKVSRESFQGAVFNFASSGSTPQSHIVVAEGVLVGDLNWQNALEEEMEAIEIRQ